MKKCVTVLASLVAFAGAASAQVVTIVDTVGATPTLDGVLGANEYGPGNSYAFNGSGTAGFGGTVGNGRVLMASDLSNLYIAFQPAAPVNDNFVLYLNTRAGGFTDATMNDTQDGGRAAASNLSRDSLDVFPFEADFAIVFGNFGTVVFELAGNDHNFIAPFFSETSNDFREIFIPLATLGNPLNVDFFGAYVSGDGYLSNEGVPLAPGYTGERDGGGNIGYGNPDLTVTWDGFNRFVVVPAPGTVAGLLMAAGVLARRRRA